MKLEKIGRSAEQGDWELPPPHHFFFQFQEAYYFRIFAPKTAWNWKKIEPLPVDLPYSLSLFSITYVINKDERGT